jgi:hypothetical protein
MTLLANSNTAIQSQAKVAKGISKTSLVMSPNMSQKLTIKNAAKKVKWSTSDRKVVSILGYGESKKSVAIIKSGNKPGSCTIKAKVGKKTYSCTIKVNKDNNLSRAKLGSIKQTAKKIQLSVVLHNKSDVDLEYGERYWFEKLVNGKWKKVSINNKADYAIGFEDKAWILPAKSIVKKNFTINNKIKDSLYLKSNFKKGTYRIHLDTNFKKEAFKYVIFTIK